MKEVLAMVLGLGIMCSPSISQESPTCFYFIDQIKKIEPIPNTSALWDPIAPNPFKDRSSQPDLSSWLNVRAHDNFVVSWDASQNLLTTDFGASDEKDAERNRIMTHRLISGLGLAVSYGATVIVDLLVYDPYRNSTLIPVIGPFIALGKGKSHHTIYFEGGKELLILSGVAQSAFATYFIISLAMHPKSSETKNLIVWSSFNSINLRIQF